MTLLQSLRLLRTEAVITSAVISMPIMNTFFASIGLDQGQIGLSQALFTVALLLFNIPTGWLADRFSRKISNAAGDAVVAGGFLFYALANGFADVVIAEVIIGIGMAFTHGADVGLLRAHCQELKRSYKTESALIASIRPLVEGSGVIIGGIIGAGQPRLAITLTAVPFLAGAILSLLAKEVGARRQEAEATAPKANPLVQMKAAFGDMKLITIYALHGHKDLAWSIIAATVAREITHALIWLLTPLLLLAGVPAAILGVAWAVNLLAVSIGASLSRLFIYRWSEAAMFAVPAGLSLLAMSVLAWNVSLWTIGLYAIFGLSRGWYTAVMPPIVQHHTPEDMQSTVFSIGGSLSQLLYIGVVIIVNMAGNFGLHWALITNALLFAPLVVAVTVRLRKLRG